MSGERASSGPILAHNCSGLSDCYDTLLAALLVVLGLILLAVALWYFWPLIARFALGGFLRGRVALSGGRLASGLGRLFGRRSAYDIARAGGRHAGTLRNYAGRSAKEIARGIRGYRRQVAEHLDKLRNPAKYVDDWAGRSPEYQKGLLRKWANDAKRNRELAELLEDLLRTKGGVP